MPDVSRLVALPRWRNVQLSTVGEECSTNSCTFFLRAALRELEDFVKRHGRRERVANERKRGGGARDKRRKSSSIDFPSDFVASLKKKEFTLWI